MLTRARALGWAHRLKGIAAHIRAQDVGLDFDATELDSIAGEIQVEAGGLRSTGEWPAVEHEVDPAAKTPIDGAKK